MIDLKVTSRDDVDASWLDDEQQLESMLGMLAGEARAMDQLHMVSLGTKQGRSLTIVLGGDESVVIFGFEGRVPPYCHSLGSQNTFDPAMRCLSMRKHEVNIPRRLLVPMDQALQAAWQFAATGDRPDCIRWEEMVD